MKFAILIPAYNEEKNIANVLTGSHQFKFIKDKFVVDDGSMDRTSLFAKEAGAHVLSHQKNSGKGAALVTGFFEIGKRDFDAAVTPAQAFPKENVERVRPFDVPCFM